MGRKIDLTGQRFGKWTVIVDSGERNKHKKILWECLCDCGNIGYVDAQVLRSGRSISCGCSRVKDLSGKRYGKLIVTRLTDKRYTNKSVIWECICDCGRKTEVASSNLRHDGTLSCGKCICQNIANKKFGKLLVTSYTGTVSKHGKRIYSCLCDCGNTHYVDLNALSSGNTQSCGCINIEKIKARSGVNSPRYNPNLTDEERLYNRYQLYGVNTKKWAREVHVNYGFTCQKCNSYSKNLNAHHLNAWNAFPEQRFDTANGITLCEECHKEYHHFNGYGDNTLEQFRDHIACIVGEEHISEIEETLLSRESEIIGQEEVQQPTRELQTI